MSGPNSIVRVADIPTLAVLHSQRRLPIANPSEIKLPSNLVNQTLCLHQGDITLLEVDAIVNAANFELSPGQGVCGAIHRAAGPGLHQECKTHPEIDTSQAVITSAHNLPCRFVIHAVGPVYDETENDAYYLAETYRAALNIAEVKQLESIAFPCLSTGVYHYPHNEAADVAISAVREWLLKRTGPGSVKKIIFCIFLDEDMIEYHKSLP